jgi:hypothetical protein
VKDVLNEFNVKLNLVRRNILKDLFVKMIYVLVEADYEIEEVLDNERLSMFPEVESHKICILNN